MSYAFCLDFGNTKKKIGIFKNNKMLLTHDVSLHTIEKVKALLQKYKPQYSILSSVVKHDNEFETLLQKETHFFLLNHLTPLPFLLPFAKKESVGADRLALIAAAIALKKKNTNFLIIALGTCITYNFLNTKKMFLGGSISPGVQMRFKSMHQQTALLPLVELTEDAPLIGYDTKTNLMSGVVFGVVNEVDGIINAFKKKYYNVRVIITGGDADFFVKRLKNNIFADNFFLFKGLYEIIKFQKK